MPLTSLPDLLSHFRNDVRVARVAKGLQPANARVQISGTIGSSQALIANAVTGQHSGVHVFVLTDKEEAAYFINDLEALRGKEKDVRNTKKDEDMLFYPAPSRSPYDPDFLQHPFFITKDHFRRFNFQQSFQTVITDNNTTIKIIQIR